MGKVRWKWLVFLWQKMWRAWLYVTSTFKVQSFLGKSECILVTDRDIGEHALKQSLHSTLSCMCLFHTLCSL